MGLSGPLQRRVEVARAGPRAPPPLVRIGQGEGGGAPPPFLLSLLFPTSRILFQQGKGGILLPVGVGLLLARPPPGRPHPPLILYIRGQGAPLDTQVDPHDRFLSRVRCPLPP